MNATERPSWAATFLAEYRRTEANMAVSVDLAVTTLYEVKRWMRLDRSFADSVASIEVAALRSLDQRRRRMADRIAARMAEREDFF